MKKKILGTALATCLLVPSVFGLTGCGTDTDRTMNVSINPELSFVVDKNDKIVNVIYENEDAGQIYANINFVGMDADDAVEELIERATVSGYFTFDGQKVTLEVNGSDEKDIEDLEKLAKKEIEKTYAEFGISVTVNLANFAGSEAKAALVTQAAALSPEKTTEELNAMNEEQLVELIKTKQEELKGLAYDQVQEIKEAFGAAENAILEQIESLRANLASVKTDLSEKEQQLAQFPSLQATLQPLIDGFKTQITNIDTQIQTAVNQYLQAKQQAITAAKELYATHKQALVDAYKSKLLAAETTIMAQINQAGNTLTQEQKDHWQDVIEDAKEDLGLAD